MSVTSFAAKELSCRCLASVLDRGETAAAPHFLLSSAFVCGEKLPEAPKPGLWSSASGSLGDRSF